MPLNYNQSLHAIFSSSPLFPPFLQLSQPNVEKNRERSSPPPEKNTGLLQKRFRKKAAVSEGIDLTERASVGLCLSMVSARLRGRSGKERGLSRPGCQSSYRNLRPGKLGPAVAVLHLPLRDSNRKSKHSRSWKPLLGDAAGGCLR